METSWRLSEGDEVINECVVQRSLGGGNAYEVFQAFDKRRLTPVVIKIVRPHLVEDQGTIENLVREVGLVGRMAHQNIVRGLHADTESDRPYLALERVSGPSLSSLIRRFGPISIDQLIPLAMELCAALHYMQQLDVVHLDLKPSNVIMDTVPKLIDFSIARKLEDAKELEITSGTDQYLAPEQVNPPITGRPSFATDVWGLGATLYHAISGLRPFESSQVRSIDNPESWPQLTLAIKPLPNSTPTWLSDLVMACLSINAESRPTPIEVFDSLDNKVAGSIGKNARFKLARIKR